MKNWVWIAFVFIITCLIIFLLNVPLWAFIIIFVPLLVIVFTYGSFMYSFRSSICPKPIPSSGYQSRVTALEKEVDDLMSLGFEKFDEFHLKTIPDTVVYAFRHHARPVLLAIYHFGPKTGCDLISTFENDYALTTCNNVDGGMAPRPDDKYLQIFPGESYPILIGEHLKAYDFLIDNGLREDDVRKKEFRHFFMQSFHQQADVIRKIQFWPIRLIFWTVTRRGRMYCKSIEEQFLSGMSIL